MRGAEVAEALGLERITSAGILGECVDTAAAGYKVSVENDVSYRVSATQSRTDTPLRAGLIALDCDVARFDKSQSKKKRVPRTDGYAPMAAPMWGTRTAA